MASLDGKVALVTGLGVRLDVTDQSSVDEAVTRVEQELGPVDVLVLPSMLDRRSGRIINISSMAGKEGLPNLAHYCATKFGVIGLTQSLAKEVAVRRGHRARLCLPGL
jgi:NAD(P)-dependent dehydrogenase (short-subunit alcohol dehydrogenase family)